MHNVCDRSGAYEIVSTKSGFFLENFDENSHRQTKQKYPNHRLLVHNLHTTKQKKKGKKFLLAARIGLRPVLAADKNFSPFFAFLAKTHPKPPFGIPRALQPPKTNIIIFLVILFCIDSHSRYHI